MMRYFLFLILLFSFSALLSQNPESNKPNVLLIMVDDMNDWVGCLGGHPNALTPNIDQLASKGVLFTNAHTAAPVCNPSRVALLSGMAPYSTGVYQNRDSWHLAEKLKNVTNLPLHFKQHGYYTMTAGKIFHSRPENWEEAYDEMGGHMGGQNFHLFSSEYTYPFSRIGGVHNFAFHWGPIDEPEAQEFSDPKIAAWATERLNREYDQPFFLSVGFHRPHTPLTSPRKYHQRFADEEVILPVVNENDLQDMPVLGRQIATAGWQEMQNGSYKQVKERKVHEEIVKGYLAACTFVDEQVGKVISALENSRHAENTIVVFASDHGWSLGEQMHFKKWALWENTTRVPMVVYAPGKTSNGKKIDAGVTLLDIFPTLVDLCNLPAPAHHLDGESVGALLDNTETKWKRPAITTYGRNNYALRLPGWRYIRYTDGGEELYNHANDAHEWNNLAYLHRHDSIKSAIAQWIPEKSQPAVNTDHLLPVKLTQEDNSKHFIMVTDKFIDKPITIRAILSSEAGDGEIVSLSSEFAGFSLYIKNQRLYFEIMDVPEPLQWDNLYPVKTIVKSSDELPAGRLNLEARMDKNGNVELFANGKTVGTGQAKTLSIHPAGTMTIGDAMAIEEVTVDVK